MTKMRFLMTAACLGGLLTAAAPAKAADLCVQFDGVSCDLSGDLGFFRFMGAKLPNSIKKATALHGRACGTGTVTGSAAMNTEGTFVNLSATFVCDGTPGLINAAFTPGMTGLGAVGIGESGYGAFSLAGSCTATIVDCGTEPGLP